MTTTSSEALKKVALRHESRQQNLISQRKEESFSFSDFDSNFDTRRLSISDKLLASGSTEIEALLEEFRQLQQFLNDSIISLPQRDRERRNKEMSELLQKLHAKKSSVQPTKRFAFSKKASNSSVHSLPLSLRDEEKDSVTTTAKVAGKENINSHPDNNRNNGDSLQCDIVSKKQIMILENSDTVHLSNLHDCIVICRNQIKGAALLQSLTRCVVVIHCQQMRIHDSHDCHFYCLCETIPIIEHCKAIAFAPFLKDFSDVSSPHSPWSIQVHDFDWLRSTPSPNWSILPEAERKSLNALETQEE